MKIYRILMSPLVFILAVLFDMAMMMFPFSLLVMLSFVSMIGYIISLILFPKEKKDPNNACINPTDSYMINIIISILLPIWFPFYITTQYINGNLTLNDLDCL